MNTVKDREAQEARQRYRAQLKHSAFPTIGMVHSVHEGPNRAQRRAMKYGAAARKHARALQQNIAFA